MLQFCGQLKAMQPAALGIDPHCVVVRRVPPGTTMQQMRDAVAYVGAPLPENVLLKPRWTEHGVELHGTGLLFFREQIQSEAAMAVHITG
jgi:hypothetical protein